MEQKRSQLQEELSLKDVELHEAVGVILEEKEKVVAATAKLVEATEVVNGLKAELATKDDVLKAKGAKLIDVEQALRAKEVELGEKLRALASLPDQIEETREAGSTSYLSTTFNRAPDTDFRHFGLVSLEQVQG